MSGWIRLWRKSLDSPSWEDDGLWKVWCYCLVKANYQSQWVVVGRGSEPIWIERGQFVTGRESLHKGCYPHTRRTKPSSKTTWRRLKNLEKMGNVSIKVSNQFSVVTVMNYDTYNPPENEMVQQVVPRVSRKCPASVPQVSTDKKEKKVKKEKKKGSLSAGADGLDLQEAEERFVTRWNATPGVRQNRGKRLTPKRRAVFRARFRDEQWRQDVVPGLEKFPLPCFEDGEWKPNVDWILKPDSLTQVIEGKYDWTKNKNGKHEPEEEPREYIN